MLLATSCAWAGCDAKAEWCQADHSISWKQHGPTVPRNGGPLCPRHNVFKEQGFRVVRDDDGQWHYKLRRFRTMFQGGLPTTSMPGRTP